MKQGPNEDIAEGNQNSQRRIYRAQQHAESAEVRGKN
jgi:hypothetical protein